MKNFYEINLGYPLFVFSVNFLPPLILLLLLLLLLFSSSPVSFSLYSKTTKASILLKHRKLPLLLFHSPNACCHSAETPKPSTSPVSRETLFIQENPIAAALHRPHRHRTPFRSWPPRLLHVRSACPAPSRHQSTPPSSLTRPLPASTQPEPLQNPSLLPPQHTVDSTLERDTTPAVCSVPSQIPAAAASPRRRQAVPCRINSSVPDLLLPCRIKASSCRIGASHGRLLPRINQPKGSART